MKLGEFFLQSWGKYQSNRTAGQHNNDNKPQNKAIFYAYPFGMC